MSEEIRQRLPSRRNWGVLCAVVVLLPIGATSDAAAAELTEDELLRQRKAARMRQRRIIMNNDGNDFNRLKPDEPKTREKFLSMRTTPLLGTYVDSVFYCTGVFNYYTHRSDETELQTHDSVGPRYLHELIKLGTDTLETMVDFCHRHGIECFWSMRMNDTHDSANPDLFCKWKRDHPEVLVGKKSKRPRYGCGRWSSVDYGHPKVRDKVYRILADVCRRYDVDGIEMDFFRHPVLFRPQVYGEPVTQKHCDQMTALVRRIRAMADDVGRKRGRPVLIAVRIPDSVGYCKAMGIDLVRWLEEDLIDIITGGGYFKLEPWETFVALGKKHGVPFYACLCSRRLAERKKLKDREHMLKRFRGEAYLAWKGGVSGIYTFNQFNPRAPVFRELGDPDLLEKLSRIDRTAYVEKTLWSKPGKWVKGGDKFVNRPSQ